MNNYGFGEDQVKSTNTPFPAAKDVADVEITGCEYVYDEKDGKWEAINITYTRGASSVQDRMFAVNPDNISPRPWIPNDTVEDATDNAYKIFNTQLLHIATKLGLTAEDLGKCNTKSFKTLATDYSNLIMKNCSGVKLYLKTVKTRNGDKIYTKVGRSTSSTMPFLQTMDGPCTLEYSDKEALAMLANTTPANGVVGAKQTDTQWVPQNAQSNI